VISGNKKQKKNPSKSGNFGKFTSQKSLVESHYKCFVTKWKKFAGKKNADALYLLLMMN
jgi:hypothetical protein